VLFDLTFPCYLITFSGKKCLSGKVIRAFFVPIIEVLLYIFLLSIKNKSSRKESEKTWNEFL
jgi:hypothetical protein